MSAAIQLARPQDLDAVFALLSANDFPLDGLAEHLGTLLVARRAGQVIGSAALEMVATVRYCGRSPCSRSRAVANTVGRWSTRPSNSQRTIAFRQSILRRPLLNIR